MIVSNEHGWQTGKIFAFLPQGVQFDPESVKIWIIVRPFSRLTNLPG